MKVVTLCGSMRFEAQMKEIAWDLETRQGVCVLTCISSPGAQEPTPQQLEALALAHRQKIDLADAVFVVNPGGYIGQAVAGELEYARAAGKQILWLQDTQENRP